MNTLDDKKLIKKAIHEMNFVTVALEEITKSQKRIRELENEMRKRSLIP